MDHAQLNIFSWQNETLAKGYNKLAAFSFDEAEVIFTEIKMRYMSTDTEVDEALILVNYWRIFFEQIEDKSVEHQIRFLHEEVSRFRFSKTWGMELLRAALIRHVIGLMRQRGEFFITEQVALSDLYSEVNSIKMAEQVLTRQLSLDERDNNLRFRLAHIMWHNGLKGEAKKHYALGLIYNPVLVPRRYLSCSEISELINRHGPEMTPAYGWVDGIIPLLHSPEDIPAMNDAHRKALACYRLLTKAERASKNRNIDGCVEYRKELKKSHPGFYEAYFTLLSKRTQPRQFL
ncbi:MAG: hypothetical protein ACFCU6_03265 [Balneolaceae bacterium]